MKNLRRLPVSGFAPEDPLFDTQGALYSGLRNEGKVIRIPLGGGTAEVVAETGGMPLGLDWLPDGRLLVCNAELGPQVVDLATAEVEPLTVRGIVFGLCNNAHVCRDGTIYISDSSLIYGLDQFEKDLIENTATGRLIKVSPEGHGEVVLDGLSFANGVVFLEEQNEVLVAETGGAKIHRVPMDGRPAALFAKVDGHPDNMSLAADGTIWVAIPSVLNQTLFAVHKLPLILRKLVAALPASLQPKPLLCCIVDVYAPDGTHLRRYEGDTSVYSFVTGVRMQFGKVALGSIEQDAMAMFDV